MRAPGHSGIADNEAVDRQGRQTRHQEPLYLPKHPPNPPLPLILHPLFHQPPADRTMERPPRKIELTNRQCKSTTMKNRVTGVTGIGKSGKQKLSNGFIFYKENC